MRQASYIPFSCLSVGQKKPCTYVKSIAMYLCLQVGLGQSEIMIDEASDLLLLLVPPGGGDELQGVKKGIMEVRIGEASDVPFQREVDA